MTVMVTRRTLRRTHLLRPDRTLSDLFIYWLAVLAQRYDIEVHAAVVMSTHEHLILTDTRGELPRFLQELHRLLALGIKVLRKWDGAVWDHEKPSVVELRTPEAVLEKLAYVMANPVTAGLVKRSTDWPGVMTRPDELGCAIWTAARPAVYVDQNNPRWPDVATLHLSMPRLEISAPEARSIVAAEVERCEAAAHGSLEAERMRVVGRNKLTTSSPYERAKSPEPLRKRNPCFAVGRGQRAAFADAVTVLRGFRNAHRVAREAWRSGVREVIFPAGTWLMRWVHGASVATT